MRLLDFPRIFLIFSAFCIRVLLGSDDVIRTDGQVMLASLFEVNEANSNGTCGKLFDLEEMRNAYAVQWFVEKLNQRNYIPGVKIGLETWRTCFSRARAIRAVFSLTDTYLTNTSDTQPPLAGIIGPSRTDTAVAVSEMISSLPEGQRVPQISGSATGIALGNKTAYANFFRVIPPDGAQIQVITELLLKLRWNYIAIVYTDEEYGRTAADALLQKTRQKDICVPVYAAIPMHTGSREFNDAVKSIVGNMKGKAAAGVSSNVLGAVFIGGVKQAQQFAMALEDQANFVELIFSEALALQTSAMKSGSSNIGVTKGALTVTPMYRKVEEFRQVWNNLWKDCSDPPPEVTNNTWLKDLIKDKVSDCGTQLKLGSREQMLFTWYHVQAAAMFAAALKTLHSQACSDVPGPCSEFVNRVRSYQHVRNIWRAGVNLEAEFGNVVASLKGMSNVSFDEKGEVITNSSQPLYEVYNFRDCSDNRNEFCFIKVGTSSGGTFSLNLNLMIGYSPNRKPWKDLDRAQCGLSKDCLECIQRKTYDSALVIPGDFYFVAVVPVHSRDPEDPLECGKPRPNLGADFVQAIQFALHQVNKEGGKWEGQVKGKKLGAIILDSCYSQLVVKNKLLQLHKGHIMELSGPMDETHVRSILLKRIAGYIGGFFSVISLAMSDILTGLDRKAYVQLSPTSVAPGLSDRKKHPYFMRLTVSANSEIVAMMDMLVTLSARFVQIMYDPVDSYSADLTKEFETRAGEYGVCVAQKIKVTLASDKSQYSKILQRLREKSSARMVIVILQYEVIVDVMDHLIGDGSHMKPEDNFVFLGSEAWARRTKIIERKQRLAGSITVAEEIAVPADFTEYFRKVDPLNTSNIWLREYWEARENCYFDLSFRRKGKIKQCEADVQKSYTQDPWVSYYIQAVYAFASGVGKALKDICPAQDKDICPTLMASTLVEKMKEVKLDLFSIGNDQKVFDSNGDGENGYKFMQAYWDSASSSMKYRQIGTWTVGGRLSLTVSVADLYTRLPVGIEPKNYNSSCSSPVECQICPAKAAKKGDDDQKTITMIPAVVVIVILAIFVVVLVVVLVLVIRRARLMIYKSRTDTEIRFENASSGLSSISHQPVQEMYQSRGAAVPPYPGDPQGDYAQCGEAMGFYPTTPTPERPPVPCGARSRDTYLTPTQASAAVVNLSRGN